jgi:hypothetical protein
MSIGLSTLQNSGAIEQMFVAQSKARVSNLQIAIANTKRHQFNTTSIYLTKMRGFADELVAAGRVLLDKELVSYILAGLGSRYDALVAALSVVTTPLSLGMLYSQILFRVMINVKRCTMVAQPATSSPLPMSPLANVVPASPTTAYTMADHVVTMVIVGMNDAMTGVIIAATHALMIARSSKQAVWVAVCL